MKILQDNYHTPEYKRHCQRCKSLLLVEKEDLKKCHDGFYTHEGLYYFECPCCGYSNIFRLRDNEFLSED